MKRFLLLFVTITSSAYSGSLMAQVSFSGPTSYNVATTQGFAKIKSVDVNNDGFMDILGIYSGDQKVSVLLNNGDGTFTLGQSIAVITGNMGIATGDFNGDGFKDFAVMTAPGNVSSLEVYLNNSGNAGTFALGGTYPGVQFSTDLEAIDFNNDGFLDLVNAGGSAGLTFFQNDGQGAFTMTGSLAAGDTPWDIAVSDFDGDGYQDLAVESQYAASGDLNILKIFKNDQNGHFAMSSSYAASSSGSGIVVKDINHDGKPDIVTTSPNDGMTYPFLNNGSGVFTPLPTISSGGFSTAVVSQDFDGDGFNDLAVGSAQGNSVGLYMNSSTSPGSFNSGISLAAPFPWSLISEDFNNDSKPDLAVLEIATSNVSIYLNTTNFPLPVKLMTFTGQMNQGTAQLNWTSGVETSFDRYEVEKSLDGTTYVKVGVVKAKGSDNAYQFTVPQKEATSLYRLKLVNDNGSFKNSDIVTLNNPNAAYAITLSPNPASSFIHVQTASKGILHIFDASGKLIRSSQLGIGDNKINIQKLSAGVYFGVIGATKLKFIKY